MVEGPMTFEGIIIFKTPYKERDSILQLLLRNGRTVSVYVYGGQGGGKKNKGSIIELGHMVRIVSKPEKKTYVQKMLTAKEVSLLWDARFIRKNIDAFYLMCFFFEITKHVALPCELGEVEEHGDQFVGIFSTLSNALFYLNESIKEESFELYQHLNIFFTKLIHHLGILPQLEHCHFCFKSLSGNQYLFEHKEGSFVCLDCVSQKDVYFSNDREQVRLIHTSASIKNSFESVLNNTYKDWKNMASPGKEASFEVYSYFCFHFNLGPKDLKSGHYIF